MESNFKFNDYREEHRPYEGLHKRHYKRIPRICCKSGLSFSAQADEFAYCEPRENADYYWKVEVGFPSEKVEEFMPYAEDPDKPTDTVYGYVPIEIVEAVVNKNGGA